MNRISLGSEVLGGKVWELPGDWIALYLTMLLMSGADSRVRAETNALARWANIDEADVPKALEALVAIGCVKPLRPGHYELLLPNGVDWCTCDDGGDI